MSKSYIRLAFRHKRYKLYTADIQKVYKVIKRQTPTLPVFFQTSESLLSNDYENAVNTQNLG